MARRQPNRIKKEDPFIYIVEEGKPEEYPSYQTAFTDIDAAIRWLGIQVGNTNGWRFSSFPWKGGYSPDGKKFAPRIISGIDTPQNGAYIIAMGYQGRHEDMSEGEPHIEKIISIEALHLHSCKEDQV
jgi:hypothetical protein